MTGLPQRSISIHRPGLFGTGLAVGCFGTSVSELVVRGVAPSVAGLGATLFLFGQSAVAWPTDVFARVSSVCLAAAGVV